MDTEKEKRLFPLFVDLTEKQVLVIGAGKIAARRILTMVDFVGGLTVVAPRIEPQIRELADRNRKVALLERHFSPEDLEGRDIVLAAADDPVLNGEVVRKCREKGILVNAAHDQNLCDFFFPGVIRKGSIVAGISSCGRDHAAVRETAARIREVLDEKRRDGSKEDASP